MNRHNHALTESERARIEQIDKLVVQGGVDELIGALSDTSWTVRRAIVAGLASLGDDAVPRLARWLRDSRSSEAAIAAAVDAMSASIGTSVTNEALQLLLHANPAVAADGAQILGRRRAAEATTRLGELVHHRDDNVAVAAIEALGAIGGGAAVDALISVVESRKFFRTFPAIQVLARTGDPRAVAPLTALLADETYRLEVVRALGRTGSAHAIGPILSLLKSPSDAIVRLVALSLADLLERADWAGSAEAISATLKDLLAPWLGRFAAALRGADPAERTAIAHVLGRAGDLSVLPAITAMLDDTATAPAATDALAYLGRTSDEALLAALRLDDTPKRIAILPLVRSKSAAVTLRTLMNDEDPEVRARTCEALARIGDTASVPLMFDALGDPSPRVAHAAISAILTLGSGETEALALGAAQSPRPAIRRHAIRLLGSFGYASAFETLVAATNDPDRRVAELATVGLGLIDDPRVEPELARLARSGDASVRAAVMRAAAHRESPASHQLLANGIADADPWVRYYATQGIGRLGSNDADASQLVVGRVQDPAPQVRIAAIEALSRIGSDSAWDAVCKAAASSDPDERRAGLVGVGLQARKGASAILIDAASSSDHATRLVAIAALARVREPEALAAIDQAIGDSNAEIRDAALSLITERDDESAA
ncbi:MAG TPA: HEAT repeat domain-containing protein, partial [Kofleriaceae bacterium]|nr:HEAT repeat domain-containing protein [Kofleriaceae bacterium]